MKTEQEIRQRLVELESTHPDHPDSPEACEECTEIDSLKWVLDEQSELL